MAGPSIRNPEQRGQAVLDLRGWCPTREPVDGARRADVAHPQAPCPGSVSATGTASADPAPGRRDRPVPADCPPRTWAPRSGPAPSPGTPRRPGHRTRAGGRRTCHSSSEDVPTTRPPALTVSGRPPVVSLGVAAVKAASSVDCPVPARRSAVQSARLSIRGATLARSPRSSTSSPGARRSGAVDSSSASSASLWAEPRCSTCSTCRPRRVAICAASAPDDVRILRRTARPRPKASTPRFLVTISAPRQSRNTRSERCDSKSIKHVARVRGLGGVASVRAGDDTRDLAVPIPATPVRANAPRHATQCVSANVQSAACPRDLLGLLARASHAAE